MSEIYSDDDIDNLVKSKYEISLEIEHLINIENKLDDLFGDELKLKNCIGLKILDKLQILSTFVRKSLYSLKLCILKKDMIYSDEILLIKNILIMIRELQEIYIQFILNRSNFVKLEVLDSIKCEQYESMIDDGIKSLNLKNI